jgi:molecular chaperone GrpE
MAENERRLDDDLDDSDVEAIELESDEDDDIEEALRQAVAAVDDVARAGSPAEETGGDVERLEREIADLRDRSARTLADFDNFRKRAERERQDTKRYALLEPMRDLVEVVDNLERALAAGGSADDLKQGIEMILRQLGEMLRRFGVQVVEAKGEPFDPAFHEAVSSQPSAEVDEPTVVEEYQKGYLLHDRLLRPARVVVAIPAADGGDEVS